MVFIVVLAFDLLSYSCVYLITGHYYALFTFLAYNVPALRRCGVFIVCILYEVLVPVL
jgi:hypothetical protein